MPWATKSMEIYFILDGVLLKALVHVMDLNQDFHAP